MTLDTALWAMLAGLGTLNLFVWAYGYLSAKASIRSAVKPRGCGVDEAVTVVIPSRNSAGTLPKVIDSIIRQDLRVKEIILVDDGSTDETPLVAAEYRAKVRNLTYLRIDDTPPGWAPKTYACHVGAERVNEGVIVFLDADTWFLTRDALRGLVCAALDGSIASYMPRFECTTLTCRAIETVLTTFSHAFLGFNRVGSQRSRISWFFGCCWGVRTDVYRKLGGHEAVKSDIVEDKALAKKAKSMGLRIRIMDGTSKVATLWYGSMGETVDALSRILHSYGSKARKSLPASIIVTLSYVLPIILLAYGALRHDVFAIVLGIINYLALTAVHSIGTSLNKYSHAYTLLTPLFGPVLAAGMLKALASRGKIQWRGRKMHLDGNQINVLMKDYDDEFLGVAM